MRILLTGAAGQLGRALAASFPASARVDAITRAQLDLADTAALRRLVRERKPDLIVNACAYTAVDRAETDAQQAFLVNAGVPEVLAQEAQSLGAALVHFSTDYVFDGGGDAPRDEQARTAPLNVYGKSKAAGEAAVAAHCDAYWIFRTSWLYGTHGRNFLTTIARLAQEKRELHVVDDQWGAPTWTGTVAAALGRIWREMEQEDIACVRATRGLYHLTAGGATNWNAFARRIVRILAASGARLSLAEEAVLAISSAAYAAPAARPANSRLCCRKFERTFGITLPHWEAALSECMMGFSPAAPE